MAPADEIPTDREGPDGREIETRVEGSTVPFEGLQAPAPLPADPPTGARWLAFASILIGGLLGGMIGYGTADVMGGSSAIIGLGAIAGAVIGAVGVGIVAGLTLRAMNEWHAVRHPEASEPNGQTRIRRAKGRRDR